MAIFKALRTVEDLEENLIIKKGETVERDGKRAEDFKESGYFEEIKEDDEINWEEKTIKEIKAHLDKKGIEYGPKEKKADLIEKIK